jgi:hypothetical protein
MSTLIQSKGKTENLFSTMFSGRFPLQRDKSGYIFLDRDGAHFRYILNYLRCCGDFTKCHFPFHNQDTIRELVLEAEYYNLSELYHYLITQGQDLSHFSDDFGSEVVVSNNKRTVCCQKANGNWNCAYVDQPITFVNTTKQCNYWEVKLDVYVNNNFYLGVQKKSSINVNNSSFDTYSYNNFQQGSIVGIYADVSARQIVFYENGKHLVTKSVPFGTNQDWMFGVSFINKDQVSIIPGALHPELKK